MEAKMLDNLKNSLSTFSSDSVVNIDPELFIGFGKKDSNEYRMLFDTLTSTKGLTKEQKTMVFVLSVVVKNRDRIIQSLNNRPELQNLTWFKKVLSFYKDSTTQYTYNATSNLMPVVNIPSSNPSLAALIWKKLTKKENRSINSFLENLWAAQLNLNSDLQEIQKTFEINFWKNVVKKTKSQRPNNYMPGFHEEFYLNKVNDKYPLLNMDLTIWNQDAQEIIDTEKLTAWLLQE